MPSLRLRRKANERVNDRPLWMVSRAIDIIWPGVAEAPASRMSATPLIRILLPAMRLRVAAARRARRSAGLASGAIDRSEAAVSRAFSMAPSRPVGSTPSIGAKLSASCATRAAPLSSSCQSASAASVDMVPSAASQSSWPKPSKRSAGSMRRMPAIRLRGRPQCSAVARPISSSDSPSSASAAHSSRPAPALSRSWLQRSGM